MPRTVFVFTHLALGRYFVNDFWKMYLNKRIVSFLRRERETRLGTLPRSLSLVTFVYLAVFQLLPVWKEVFSSTAMPAKYGIEGLVEQLISILIHLGLSEKLYWLSSY